MTPQTGIDRRQTGATEVDRRGFLRLSAALFATACARRQAPASREEQRQLDLLSLPKPELHLHLRGAMPPAFFESLVNRYQVSEVVASLSERQLSYYRSFENVDAFLSGSAAGPGLIAELFSYRSFEAFLAAYGLTGRFFRTSEDLAELIDAVADGLAAQTVTYAELTVSVNEYVVNTPMSLTEVVAAVDRGCERSSDVRLRWVVDLVRDFGPERGLELLRSLLALDPRFLVGITLGGSEDAYPASLFSQAYELARDHGLGLSIHAGEWLGPESVWEALESLSPNRIGHGVRAIEDPRLVDHLAERRIPLEISMTSNLRTGVYDGYDSHPIRRLYEAGVPITINTDDPTFFGTDLVSEYRRLEALGFDEQEIRELADNGYRHAFDAEEALASR